MACNYNIKVVEGNKFALVMPLKRRSYVSSVPIDEDIEIADLQDCVVKIGGVEYANTLESDGVRVIVPATLSRGTYDVVLTAIYHGAEIRAAYFEGLTIVKWNGQSDAQQYVQGTTVELVPAFVIGGTLTDAELEQLKAQLRLDIAAAEAAKEAADAAKEAYDEKAEALDDIARQTTLEDVQTKIGTPGTGQANTLFAAIAEAGGGQYPTDYAKQGTNANATLTETQAQATLAATDAAAAKNKAADAKTAADDAKAAAQAITGYATEVNATANKDAIIAAVQANAGVPTMTIPATTAAQELAPNTLYVFAERTTDLTLTLGAPIVGKANEYHLFLVIGGTAPTITWPAGISWNGGSAPTIAADKTYEVSILNNIAAFMEI